MLTDTLHYHTSTLKPTQTLQCSLKWLLFLSIIASACQFFLLMAWMPVKRNHNDNGAAFLPSFIPPCSFLQSHTSVRLCSSGFHTRCSVTCSGVLISPSAITPGNTISCSPLFRITPNPLFFFFAAFLAAFIMFSFAYLMVCLQRIIEHHFSLTGCAKPGVDWANPGKTFKL